MQIVHTTEEFFPTFSPAVISKSKDTVYVSGSIGVAPDYATSKRLADGGMQGQAIRTWIGIWNQRAALANMAKVLAAAGSGPQHVLKTLVFLTDLPRDFAAMNEVYGEFFEKEGRGAGAMPARTCIGVAALPFGALFEIECVAEIPGA